MLALRFNTNVLDEMFDLARGLDNVFSNNGNGTARRAGWAPAVDVHETEDLVTLAVELPGVNPQDVKVTAQNGLLTIAGEKNGAIAKDEANGAVRYNERWYGRFERTFTLPTGVEPGKVEASYDAGILTIRLHKSEQARARQIPITLGAASQAGRISSGQK